jgi:quercetin dioxygenase-like cupin family protein
MFKRTALCAVIIACGAAVGAGPLAAQPPVQQPIKRVLLQKASVPGTNYEAVFGRFEIAPNAVAPRHTHPGIETGYVMQGSLILQIEGRPPLALKAGQSYQVPNQAVHGGKAGPEGAKAVAVWIVEKGKPLATPAK